MLDAQDEIAAVVNQAYRWLNDSRSGDESDNVEFLAKKLDPYFWIKSKRRNGGEATVTTRDGKRKRPDMLLVPKAALAADGLVGPNGDPLLIAVEAKRVHIDGGHLKNSTDAAEQALQYVGAKCSMPEGDPRTIHFSLLYPSFLDRLRESRCGIPLASSAQELGTYISRREGECSCGICADCKRFYFKLGVAYQQRRSYGHKGVGDIMVDPCEVCFALSGNHLCRISTNNGKITVNQSKRTFPWLQQD